MSPKILALSILAVILAASPALAENARRPAQQKPGEARYQCFSGPDGQGRVIQWAQNREQCRLHQGRSWGYPGNYEDIPRGPVPPAAQAPPPDNPIYQQPGAVPLCFFGFNGRGKVIKWAKTKEQCRNQSNGKSWGHSGHYENFYRETRQPWR